MGKAVWRFHRPKNRDVREIPGADTYLLIQEQVQTHQQTLSQLRQPLGHEKVRKKGMTKIERAYARKR